ncbi:uncharacterized protein B0T23DRAFT_81581 [Neurospora hispaniola]|uniref:Uncharacterized protein n=1 Tax=Neurospora hispaniola TaxID=588809 RepID=A0AAJ0MTT9_9PEZI|nr:hypothetical protein B0T23DRAFT_81581 [Neurospora hispaniola]
MYTDDTVTISIPVCADCFKGTLRGDVIPSGHEDVIHGLPTYIATPKWKPWVKPLGTVVLTTNAFGWSLRNTRALADSYARRVSCILYVPDCMDGKAIPLSLMASFESKPIPILPGSSVSCVGPRTLSRPSPFASSGFTAPVLPLVGRVCDPSWLLCERHRRRMVNLRKSALLGFAGVGSMLSASPILRIPTTGCLYVMEKRSR